MSPPDRAAQDASTTPRWPASLAVVAAIALYAVLPDRLVLGPKWAMPVLEAALLIPLTLRSPRRHHAESQAIRLSSLALIALINLANLASLFLLAHYIVTGGATGGRALILSSMSIWLTNVLIFGLWYWELDRGGPGARTAPKQRPPDFLFPQMANPDVTMASTWRPNFFDYVYVSFTNATAFSPTDTMPLSLWVKALMAVQSLASLITVALVAARAVNILN